MKYNPIKGAIWGFERWAGPTHRRDAKRERNRAFRHTTKYLVYLELKGEEVSHRVVHYGDWLM